MQQKICIFVILLSLKNSIMKIFKSVFVLSIVVGGIFGVYTNHVNSQVSDLLLENVEALANGEESQPGNYNVYTQYTDYTMNGVVYKQTKVVNCEVGGSFACSGGNFYRYKKDNGEWDEWRRV